MIRGPKSGPIQALRPVPVPEPPRWLSTVERLSALRDAGPRIPTGFANLDAVLHGGLRSGKLFCISGGPSAWKTSVCVQLGDHFAEQGAAVLWIAFDECAESIDSRRLQARGVPRLETEQPTERTMRVAAELDTLPFHVVEPQPTEDAIEAFSEKYPQRLRVVFIDSIQGSYTRNSDRFDSRRDKVDDAVRTLRRYAERRATECIVICTSEVGRTAYGNRRSVDDMAASKWSGSVEYGFDVLAVLRLSQHDEHRILVTLPKNRLGLRVWPRAPLEFTADPIHVRLSPVIKPTPEQLEADALSRDVAKLVAVVATNPGIDSTDLKARSKLKGPRHNAALAEAKRSQAIANLSDPRAKAQWHVTKRG